MSVAMLKDVDWRLKRLPTLSEVAIKALQIIDSEEVDLRRLEAVIVRDQGLVARILRIANSPFYGVARSVSTVRESIILLGVQTVRNVIATAAVIEIFPESNNDRFDRLQFWGHSLRTAVACQVLAAEVDVEPDMAFCAGLLHDIGRLVMDTCFPDLFGKALQVREEQNSHYSAAEVEIFGFDHASVGGSVAEYWSFPVEIQEAIARHHSPDMEGGSRLVAVVHIGDAIARALGCNDEDHDTVAPISDTAWQSLGLEGDRLSALIANVDHYAQQMQVV
jgi:putative nucleotidyltransferase with HDIG domain